MAIVREAATYLYSSTAGTTHTVSYSMAKGSSDNRKLYAMVMSYQRQDPSATFNGTAGTRIALDTGGGTAYRSTALFVWDDSELPLDTSAHDIVVTWEGSDLYNFFLVLEVSGADQAAAENTATELISNTTCTVTLTGNEPAADIYLMYILVSARTASSEPAGAIATITNAPDQDDPAEYINRIRIHSITGPTPAAATDYSWVVTVAGAQTAVAFELKAAAGGGGALTLDAVTGVGNSSSALAARRVLSATAAGVGGASVSAGGTRQLDTAAAGVSTVTVDMGAVRHIEAAAAGSSTASTEAGVLRALSVAVQGSGTASASLSGTLAVNTTAAGSGTAVVSLAVVRPRTAAATGVGAASVDMGALRTAESIATGVGAASVDVHMFRGMDAASAGASDTSASLALVPALRYVTASASGLAAITLTVTKLSSASSGKYAPEHAGALADLAASTGFAAEHSGALSDLASAGV